MASVKAEAAAPPAIVQVGPMRYEVLVDELAILKAGLEEEADLHGSCDERTQRIVLNPASAPDILAEAFLHEVLHAVCFLTGVDHALGPDKVEAVIRSMSPALLDVLRRNPDLVTYVTAER